MLSGSDDAQEILEEIHTDPGKSENADVDFDPKNIFFESMIDDSDFATKIMGIGFETVENGRNTFLIDF